MDLYLLDLKRFIKDPLIGDNTIKADIFIIKFFFKTGIIVSQTLIAYTTGYTD